jgi:hypothetical protein
MQMEGRTCWTLTIMLLLTGLSEFQRPKRNGRSLSRSRRRFQLVQYTRGVCAIEGAAHAPEIAPFPV